MYLAPDNRVFNGPFGHWLYSFPCTSPIAYSLYSAPLGFAGFATFALQDLLSYTRFANSFCFTMLTDSLHSLPCGTVKIYKYVSTLSTRLTGTILFVVSTRNTPLSLSMRDDAKALKAQFKEWVPAREAATSKRC